MPVWLDYKKELDAVEGMIKEGLDSEVPLIKDVAQYTLRSGGKRIRPLLLIVSAKLCQVADQKNYMELGSIVEFIHTATLLHDDVLDNAKIRRGQPAARNLYGNRVSILVGDFLYTCAVRRVVHLENVEINHLLSTTCQQMIEGEALQLSHTSNVHLPETIYFKIIEYKTASLFSASCKLGGIVAQAPPEAKEALSSFGQKIGIAFQIIDDTLDYLQNDEHLGKSSGQDITGGKITLPLIHLLQQSKGTKKAKIIRLMRLKKSKENLEVIRALLEESGSIAYAHQKAAEFIQKAHTALAIFSDSLHRQALLTLANYAVERDH